MAVPGEPDQGGAQQRRGGHVEAAVAFGGGDARRRGLRFGGRKVRQVGFPPGEGGSADDELDGRAGAAAPEPGAQGGVPVQQRLPGRAQHRGVHGSVQVDGVLPDVDVAGALVVAGVEQQPLLQGRQRPDLGER
ncbi:hypothetical protein BJF79_47835 [Actinomadura sp. CNU-125]|nr:hypothetical protein [Actinomadura sp. CNU-125]OLT19356.1 hypothetical protein BJF79_47835 [Actinomadura sp. CNU-125]